MMSHTRVTFGLFVARVGLAGVLLWFGAQQLLNPVQWIGFVPPEIADLTGLTLETIVFANGIVEIVFGIFLLVGLFTVPVAFLMALHLAAIALSLGHTAVAVRDWGLAFAYLGIAIAGFDSLTLDHFFSKKKQH